ncbi:MAG: biotin/lipoyl-containing protein [Anaerolineae bacterium]|nr:biotin/lipoyl-containing protein [Anaerolineae bacterium]
MRSFRINVQGTSYLVEIEDPRQTPLQVRVNGRPFTVEVEWLGARAEATVSPAILPAVTPTPREASPSPLPPQPPPPPVSEVEQEGMTTVEAPMPGTIVEVRVKPGDVVARGDELCVLEAMKMRNSIRASRAGQVAEVLVSPGAKVAYGDPLVRFAQ